MLFELLYKNTNSAEYYNSSIEKPFKQNPNLVAASGHEFFEEKLTRPSTVSQYVVNTVKTEKVLKSKFLLSSRHEVFEEELLTLQCG